MIKKYCALITVIVVLFSLSVDSLAVTVSPGGTGYTSKQYLGATHTQYYCCLNSVKFTNQGQDYIPSGYYVYARIRNEIGNPVGDLAGFSATGSGYHYNYWSGSGNPGWYKLATNSNYGYGYTASFNWHP